MSVNARVARDKRRYDLDLLRVVAIFAVIIVHCISDVMQQRPIGQPAWYAVNIIDSFMRWCVPVFIMISGALLIREDAFKNQKQFFKKRFNRIFIPLLAWPILYVIFQYAVYSTPTTLIAFVKGFVTATPLYGFHLYFLFLIAGLYFLTPMLSAYVYRTSRKQLWIMTITICAMAAIWEWLGGRHYLVSDLNMFTSGIPYIGYFLLGYLLKDTVIKQKQLKLYLAGFITSGVLIAIATYLVSLRYGSGHTVVYFYNYTNVFVVPLSVSFFMLGKFFYQKFANWANQSPARTHRVLNDLSRKSFGIYLIHIMVLDLLYTFLKLDRLALKSILITLPLTFILSWVAVTLIQCVPKSRYLLG